MTSSAITAIHASPEQKMNRKIKITGSRTSALIDIYDIPATTTEAQLLRHYLNLAQSYFPDMGTVRSVTFVPTPGELVQEADAAIASLDAALSKINEAA